MPTCNLCKTNETNEGRYCKQCRKDLYYKKCLAWDLPADEKNVDGPTIYEHNLTKEFKYKIDEIVSVKYTQTVGVYHTDLSDWVETISLARLHVVMQARDHWGNPCYVLSNKNSKIIKEMLCKDEFSEQDVCKLGLVCVRMDEDKIGVRYWQSGV